MPEQHLGDIIIFAGNYAPVGWAFCDGAQLSINENQELFSLLGTTYGGDGITTFALPDFRGRIPVGAGSGMGLTPRNHGDYFGEESVGLEASHTPDHDHGFGLNAIIQNAENIADLKGAMLAETKMTAPYQKSGSTHQLVKMNELSVDISVSGKGDAHSNMQPYLSMNFLIAITGPMPQ